MQYWLFKSEPGTWSWEDQLNKGEPEEWDGVRNYAARLSMRQMNIGDLGFFYHSVGEKRIVGIVRVASAIHPDSTTDDERWECVDVEAVQSVPNPVTLEQIKAHPDLQEMALVRISRLSVQPVTEAEWKIVCEMGGVSL